MISPGAAIGSGTSVSVSSGRAAETTTARISNPLGHERDTPGCQNVEALAVGGLRLTVMLGPQERHDAVVRVIVATGRLLRSGFVSWGRDREF